MYYLFAWSAPKPRSNRQAAGLASDVARLERAPDLLADLADHLTRRRGVEFERGEGPHEGRMLVISLGEPSQEAVDGIASDCQTRGVVLFDPQAQTLLVPSIRPPVRTVDRARLLRDAVERASDRLALEGRETADGMLSEGVRAVDARRTSRLAVAGAGSQKEFVLPLGVSQVPGVPPALTFALPSLLPDGGRTQAQLRKAILTLSSGDAKERRHATLALGAWLEDRSAHDALSAAFHHEPDALCRSLAAVALASQGLAPLGELLDYASEMVSGVDAQQNADPQTNLARSVATAAAAVAAIRERSSHGIAIVHDVARRLRLYPSEAERAEAIQGELARYLTG